MRLSAIDASATGGDSWLHGVAPRTKLAALALALGAVIVTWNAFVVASAALTLAAVAGSCRLPGRPLAALAAYPAVFAAVFAFASAPDPLTAGVIVMKAVTAALAALLVVFTTPYPQVFAPLQRVMPSIVGDSLLMTYRSMFILLEKLGVLVRAVRLRSAGRGPLADARATTRALGGLLLYALDLAQRDYDIMRLRGYEGGLRIAALRSRNPAVDAALITGTASVLAVSVAWRVGFETLNPYSWTLIIPASAAAAAAWTGRRKR